MQYHRMEFPHKIIENLEVEKLFLVVTLECKVVAVFLRSFMGKEYHI